MLVENTVESVDVVISLLTLNVVGITSDETIGVVAIIVPLLFAIEGTDALREETTELISEIAELKEDDMAEAALEMPVVALLELCAVGTLVTKVEAWVDEAMIEDSDFVSAASAAVTGQMVVPMETNSVVTAPSLPGQSLTVGAQEVIV